MTTNPLRNAAENAPGDTSANTGAIRVGTNAAVIAGVVWVVEYLTPYDIDTTHPAIIPAIAAVMAFGYRVSRLISGLWPSIGWTLFGIGDEPTY